VALSQLDNIEILKFSVIGHADEAGTDEYNFDLSVRRGDNTAAYLKKLGIENDNIYFTGKGENQPLDGDRNKNR
jgi:outer membrane protein OmpA-like peptidoglycan-associated protein